MGWLSEWLDKDEKTFFQDLELLVARWTDQSRKGREAMTRTQIGNALLDKAEQLLDTKPPPREMP